MKPTAIVLAGLITVAAANPLHAQRLDRSVALRGEMALPRATLLMAPALLSVEAVPLPDALLALERASGVRLAFSSSLLPDRAVVSCRCIDLNVSEALAQMLKETGLRFEPIDGHVVIEPDPGTKTDDLLPSPSDLAKRPLSAIAIAPPNPVTRLVQGTVAGRVTDARTGAPIASVQVHIPSLELGILTQPNGRYVLSEVAVGTHEIRVERIGYHAISRQVTVGEGTTTVDFELQEQALALDEIVVTGTAGGTQRRAIGNVVETMNVDEVLATAPVQNVQQLLSQRTTGMAQLPVAGQVGTGAPIRIRGLSSMSLRNGPLIYIDGIRMDSDPRRGPGTRGGSRISRLNDLNPQDIESIEIIKGPSAATLYGTEASNGVIQIITKRGAAGEARFDMSVRGGTNWLWNPEGRTPIRWRRNSQTGELEGFNILEQERLAGFPAVFEYGDQQGYDLSVSGGTDAVRYYTSGSWNKETGVLGYDFGKRLNLRANLELLLSEDLTVTTTTSYLQTDVRLAQNAGGFGAEPFSNVIWNFPSTLEAPQRGWFVAPPEEWGKVETLGENDRTILTVAAQHNPLEWFTQRLTVGLDINKEENSVLWPRQPEGASHFWGANALGEREVERLDHRQITLDYGASATYRRSPTLAFTTSGGLQYVQRETSAITAEGAVFPAIPITTVSGGAERDGSEDFVENSTVGVYVEEQVNWRDRVFLTGAVRGDDNSAFGTDFDAAIYPKASLTWVVHEEPFWNVDKVDQLRLRSAWGAAGQQPGTFDAPRLFDPEIGFRDNPALVPSSYGNPQLKPERSQELEYGFDLSLLNERLEVIFTRYHRWVNDAIVERPLAPSTGFTGSQIVNIGEVSGWGNELAVNARVIEGPTFDWDLGIQLSNNHNRIDDLGPGLDFVSAGTQQENVRGYSIGAYFFRHLLSAEIDEEGNVMEALCDGGTGPLGRDTGGQPVPCGEAPRLYGGEGSPTWLFGLNSTITLFDDLRLFARVEGNGGHLGFNSEMRAAHNIDITREVLCRCIPEVQATRAFENNVMGIYEAGFVRLREAGVSYELPIPWVERIGASYGSVSLAARNLMMIWTAEHGFDTYRDGRVMARDGLGGQWTWDPEIRSTGSVQADYQTVMPPLASATLTLRLSF
jgi:TonB-linked SusC/RagA family outer membrane protein